MPSDRNLSIDDLPNHVDALLAAFHFHDFGAAFFDETHGVADRILRLRVIGAERHVSD